MVRRTVMLATALIGAAACSPSWAGQPLSPTVPALARLLPAIDHADPARLVHFEISLPLRNEAALDSLIRAQTDLHDPLYRHYLTPAQFTRRFGASAADYRAVVDFAARYGLHIDATPANRRFVALSGPVRTVEQALHVSLGLYRHPLEPRMFMAPDREPAPDIAVPILAITGLDDAVRPVSHLVRGQAVASLSTNGTEPAPSGSGPGGQFIGSDMRAAYYGGSLLNGAGQSVGLLEFGGYEQSDVQLYFNTLGQPLDVPIIGVSVNGAALDCSGSCDDSEQALDIEEAIAMAPGLSNVTVYVGNSALAILNRMATDDTAMQLSSSWGWAANQAADEPVFKQFIAQGQSFVDATGDYGNHLALGVVWPADDSFVTAVGGTDLVTRSPGGPWQSETGWRFSGGGPSPNGIATPRYQTSFITPQNHGSTSVRNVPDIAAEANTDNFSCFNGGCFGGNGGTSYAAPRWAGFIALANQQAAQHGRPPVGFINPIVYPIGASAAGYGRDFHDQTSGYNGKYHAVAGFDLVTGFGSPTGQPTLNALAGH